MKQLTILFLACITIFGCKPNTLFDDSELDKAPIHISKVNYETSGITNELYNISCERTSLKNLISEISNAIDAEIIIPHLNVRTSISVNLKEVDWKPALQSILDTYDFELYQRVSGSNVYSIRKRLLGTAEPKIMETFILNSEVEAIEAAKAINDLWGDNDTQIASAVPCRKAIIVYAHESRLTEIRVALISIGL